MINNYIEAILVKSWDSTINRVIVKNDEYRGRFKEQNVSRILKSYILEENPKLKIIGPEYQMKFLSWNIDLVIIQYDLNTAIEVKYKLLSDGAVPDNRKAIFFDLFKIENYVSSKDYALGAFFLLTNNVRYLNIARGDSKDFSTHEGRLYKAGTQLSCIRNRGKLPTKLTLKNNYRFNWENKHENWYSMKFFIRE